MVFRVSSAHEEAGDRVYAVSTQEFLGDDAGAVRALQLVEVDASFQPVEGTEREIPAQLVLLAMGFLYPEQALLDKLEIAKDQRGNAKAPTYETSVEGVFAAGDARMGQSLIVWAIAEGRKCARVVDRYLIGLRPAEPPLEPEEAFEPHTGELEMPSDAVYGD